MSDHKPAVLVMGTGNSCRSQMAEGFLRTWASDWLDVNSAGLEPKDAIHPMAIAVMKEIGIDISGQHPKSSRDFLGKLAVRYLIIVCSNAEQSCPRLFLGAMERHFWPFDDPAQAQGTPEERLAVFRRIRDQIAARLQAWIQTAQPKANEKQDHQTPPSQLPN